MNLTCNKARAEPTRPAPKWPNTPTKGAASSAPYSSLPADDWLHLWDRTGAPNSSWWAATLWLKSSDHHTSRINIVTKQLLLHGVRRPEVKRIASIMFVEQLVILLLFFLFLSQLCPLTSLKGKIFNLLLARSQGMFRMHLRKSTIKVFRGHSKVHNGGRVQQKPLLCVHSAHHVHGSYSPL